MNFHNATQAVTPCNRKVDPPFISCQCPSLCKVNFLTVCYKDLISCCQLQQKKRSSHQITFNTNHVLCSSAAAAGCWILWGAFSGFTLINTLETLNSQMEDGDNVDLCFHRCEQYWSHPARLKGCAAWTVFAHHLSGLWLFFDWQQPCNRLDQTAWRKTNGLDFSSVGWR